MRYLLYFVFTFIGITLFAQDVMVLDKFSNLGMPGVTVYALNYTDTLKTNSIGEVNIDIFDNNSTIIFSFPYFTTARYTKEQLAKLHNTIYLERGDELKKISSTSPLRSKEYSADLPFFIDIVDLDEPSMNFETEGSGDRITFTNNNGGLSVFRGLDANKMLIAIDGIRLNNAIYKNGKVDRLLSFDNTMALRVQQIYGTGFTSFSSEAIGGVIHYFTHIPKISQDYAVAFQAETNVKYESATNSTIGNINFSISSLKLSSFTSVSYGNFGEIRMGANRKKLPAEDSLYGYHLEYIERNDNVDLIINNKNPLMQVGTDYEQLYLLQKLRFKTGNYSNLLLNFHFVNTSELAIYSGLREINGDHLRFSECNFEPQNKYLASVNYMYERKTRFFDFLSSQLSYNFIEEYRITRKYNNNTALHQIESLDVIKFNADFVKVYNVNRLLYGIQYDYNRLNSEAFFYNILTNEKSSGLNRYPTLGSFSNDFSAYANFKYMRYTGFKVNLGLRYNFNYTNANFDITSPQLPLSFQNKVYKQGSPAASISFDTYPIRGLQVKLLLSTAKHTPVLDEFAKVMVKDFIVTIPTDDLKPETYFNSELGITITMFEKIRIYGAFFYNEIFNAIVSKDTLLNNNDSIYFGTDRYLLVTKSNIPRAFVYGASGGSYFNFAFDQKEKIYIKQSLSFNYIKGLNKKTNEVLSNISPYYGNVGLTFNYYWVSLRLSYIFNGAKPYEELSQFGEDYIERASSSGFMAWETLNAKLMFVYKDIAKFSFGVDNIFDRFYIVYNTPVAAPGRNYIFSIKFAIK